MSGGNPLIELACCTEAGVAPSFSEAFAEFEAPLPVCGASATTNTPSTRKDRKSTRLNSSHGYISYAVFCLKKKKKTSKESGDIATSGNESHSSESLN